KAHLLRSLKVTTRTIPQRGAPPIIERNVSFELHDARAAQQTLMKYHGLLVDMPAIRDLPKTEDSSSRWPCARFSASRARRRGRRGKRIRKAGGAPPPRSSRTSARASPPNR